MLTRGTRPLVSPSLIMFSGCDKDPPIRMSGAPNASDTQDGSVPRSTVSPSLEIEELRPSPRKIPISFSLQGLISHNALPVPKEKEKMTTSSCKRASRMARPFEPSEVAMNRAHAVVLESVQEMALQGMKRMAVEEATARFKLTCASTGKGPAVRVVDADSSNKGRSDTRADIQANTQADAQAETQTIMNHLASIKAHSIESGHQEPFWLIDPTQACPQVYGHLAARAIKSNAVNSSVVNRSKTQGATNQTSRINTKPIAQAAAAQAAACAVCTALARSVATNLSSEYAIRNPMATNAANVCHLWQVLPTTQSEDDVFVATSSSRLVLNACPTKLGGGSIVQEAKRLAQGEIEDCVISERMGTANHMLTGICQSICAPGLYQLDSVWASLVLIVYLSCHPEGRSLLRKTALTDIDYQTSAAFEAYGRAEITRRARLETQQTQAMSRKRQKAMQSGPSSGPTALEMPSMPRDEGLAPGDATCRLESLEREEANVLATKRKRGAKGCAAANTNDSSGMLQWWFGALRCDNSSVLTSLIAHSKSAAKQAACQTLERQAEGTSGVANNVVIRGMSEQNAVASAQALVPFVGRKQSEIPGLHSWTWRGAEYRGISRMCSEGRTTTFHACKFAPFKLQPLASTKLAIAWSTNSMQCAPQTEECLTLPGVIERISNISAIRCLGTHGEVKASRMEGIVAGETNSPMSTFVSGCTRSVISLEIKITVTQDQVSVATDIGKEIHSMPKADMRTVHTSITELALTSQNAEQRREPLCNTGSRLALGIAMNEELRTWMMGKTRKNDACKVLLGVSSAQERVRESPSIVNAEPTPLLTITDFNMDMSNAQMQNLTDRPDSRDGSDHKDVPFNLALHVCGDAATRVPEMLIALNAELKCTSAFVAQARAVVWAAMSQASYICAYQLAPQTLEPSNPFRLFSTIWCTFPYIPVHTRHCDAANVGPTISAGYANCAISSSKKIGLADLHRLPLLSAFDVYSSGLINIEISHNSTPYVGTYGCCFDHGVSPPGLFAHNIRSDKRQHGNMTLSSPMADRLSARFARAHWVISEDGTRFCEAPLSTRGVPHNLQPGIHAALDQYTEALETLRRHTGRENAPTVDSLTVLPFSAWTQALSPVIEATADISTRQCVRDPTNASMCTGRAYLPDSTLDEEALVREPLFRRPSQASASDNPFATSYEHVDSFFNLANSLVLLARCAAMEVKADDQPPDQPPIPLTDILCERINRWVNDDTDPRNALFCADACLMLNLMYPSTFNVVGNILLPVWAQAVPNLQRKLAQQKAKAGAEVGATLSGLDLPTDAVEEGRVWWSKFTRDETGVWKNGPLGKLLRLLDACDGSHSIERRTYASVRDALEKSVQAAWLVASPDGVTPPARPHPCCETSSPSRVRRPVIDPVFVGNEKRGIEQRGALVGVKPHQLRQVCALAMGAFLPDVTCQVARNEGGLSLRVSSAADILDDKGQPRSAKSVSPVQTEADEQAFGSREDKLRACALQRAAWDTNTELLTALFVAVREPLPAVRRLRGEAGATYAAKNAAAAEKRDQFKKSADESASEAIFKRCTVSKIAKLTNAV